MDQSNIKTNEELLVERFIEANERFREILPELHELILAITPFTQNKVQVTNAWTNFKQMDQWISCVMKDGFEMMNPKPTTTEETLKEETTNG